MLSLRLATILDAAFLYRLRLDPATVAASPGPPPGWEGHVDWLTAFLARSDRRLFIGLGNKRPHTHGEELAGLVIDRVGTGRLDLVDHQSVELSWTIAPESRGHRYCEPLIVALKAEASKVWPGVRQVAQIHPGNVASLRAALAAGFQIQGMEMVRLEAR